MFESKPPDSSTGDYLSVLIPVCDGPATGGKPALRQVHLILREVGEKGRGKEGSRRRAQRFALSFVGTDNRLKPIPPPV
jgi:hypothetical protein